RLRWRTHRCPVRRVVARRRGRKVESWPQAGPLGGRQASPDVEGVVGEYHLAELGGAARKAVRARLHAHLTGRGPGTYRCAGDTPPSGDHVVLGRLARCGGARPGSSDVVPSKTRGAHAQLRSSQRRDRPGRQLFGRGPGELDGARVFEVVARAVRTLTGVGLGVMPRSTGRLCPPRAGARADPAPGWRPTPPPWPVHHAARGRQGSPRSSVPPAR